MDAQQLVLQITARDGVEGTEGLVEQHEPGLGGEGARQAHALLLAARELRGPAITKLPRVEPHKVEQLVHARGGAGAVPLEDARHGGDVLPHAHVREQADLLNHVADTSTKLHRVDR